MHKTVPIVDISRYLDGSDPMGVVLELQHAATRVGFFQVVGHGVPHELIDSTRQAARRFFRATAGPKIGVGMFVIRGSFELAWI